MFEISSDHRSLKLNGADQKLKKWSKKKMWISKKKLFQKTIETMINKMKK